MADDMTNLNPSSTREWLMHLSGKMDAMDKKIEEAMESQAEDRENLLAIVGKWDDWKTIHDKEQTTTLLAIGNHAEKIDHLEKRVGTWSALNSLGVIIAAILAALGLKGS